MAQERRDVAKDARGVVPLWGILGVIAFLMNGLRRVLPVALEPLKSGEMGAGMGIAYIGFSACMAYVEGYRGFHKRFSPNVVTRALTLSSTGATTTSRVLAPLYCMELFGAPPGRIVSAWSFLSSIFVLVAIVKRLPAKPRAVVDAGVCAGMSIGMLSLLYHYFNAAALGTPPPAPEAQTRTSYCPVTAMSSGVGGVVKFCAGLFFGPEAVQRLEQHEASLLSSSKALLKCPISGKNGASEAECPMARFMGSTTTLSTSTSKTD